MKRAFSIGFLILVSSLATSIKSGAQQFTTDFNIFLSPEQGPYVELYTSVTGSSLYHSMSPDSLYRDKVQITYIFKKGEEIVAFKKTEVSGPASSGDFFPDVLNQQRIPVPAGDYQLEVEVTDLNSAEKKPYSSFTKLTIDAPANDVWISGIQLAEKILKADETSVLTKSGYDIVPLVHHYYPPDFDRLAFYFEIYNSEKVVGENKKFLIKQMIRNSETGDELTQYTKFYKKSAQPVVVELNALMIDELASGSYELVFEARDRENKLLASNSTNFDRNNPMANINPNEIAEMDINGTFATDIGEDSLEYWISSIRPLSTDNEKRVMDKTLPSADFQFKQKFFYTFWQNRSSSDPAKEWYTYKSQVYKTNRLFGTTIKEGFETDRGRVYLKYGAPNSVTDRPNEPSTYPYQVWHYYKIDRFNNKRFIFYQPDLVTNDYELLHSDLRGERQNYRWKAMLNSRNAPYGNVDSNSEGSFDHWGGNSGEFYTLPR